MTEKEKMENCLIYNALDPELNLLQKKCKKLLQIFNYSGDEENQRKVLKDIFQQPCDKVFISAPFFCDFGFNINFKGLAIINYNCTMLDTAKINIGNSVFIGPGCYFTCPSHPLLAEERNKAFIKSKPITLEDNVWIGANVTILGGVTIGKNSVIGAGSVVTKDIPSDVIAIGNPCKVLRKITEDDSFFK